MTSEEQPASTEKPVEGDGDASTPTITFKVKSSGDHNHTITMPESATVLDLKTKLSGDEYEKIAADRQRLIYSGRVMKNEESLSSYKIKAGNTVHLVKSAASNVTQQSTASGGASGQSSLPAGVPRNMAAGTEANNILAGLTGARFAGHMGLPDVNVFGADGGMGAPPSEDSVATMLEDPNMQQTLNEALNNPAMVDMMINSSPLLRDNPQAREMLNSPEFRAVLTNPQMMRDAARIRRQMEGGGMGGMFGGMGGAQGGGSSAFPAPGVTDTTPEGAAGTTAGSEGAPGPPPNMGGNPFGALFNMGAMGMGGGAGAGATGAAPGAIPGGDNAIGGAGGAANPFAGLFAGSPMGNMFGPNGPPPELMQQAMRALGGGAGGMGGATGAMGGDGGGGMPNLANLFGAQAGFGAPSGGISAPPAAPADTRPAEERYAEQLRQLNDMGFFDFERNVEALRRSGGNVEGAVENLLR